MPEPRRPRALCVEDDHAGLGGLRDLLGSAGYDVEHVSWRGAPARLEASLPDLVVVQGGTAGGTWENVLAKARALRSGEVFVPVVLVADRADVSARIHGLRLGADECIEPAGDKDETLARIEALLRIKEIQDRMTHSRKELQRRSTIDGLTGLLNRRHLHERCREELRRARRYHDPLSILLVDVDDFRDVNQRLGEDVGDQVLRQVSNLLREAVRDVDLVGRQGGDTFCVLLPSTHLSGALTVGERIWRAVADAPVGAGDTRSQVTCSIGIAFFPARGVTSHEDLLRVAQEALYRAKREGKNRICLYQAAHYFYQPGDPDAGLG